MSCAATPRAAGVTGGSRPIAGNRALGRCHRRRIETNGELGQLVAELLAQRWSRQQISRKLWLRFPGDPGMWLCHESIYPAV